MAISFIAPVAAGNAVQLLISLPPQADKFRVLRKRSDTIDSVDDPGSNVVYEGDGRMVVDRLALMNGETYFYRPFFLVDGVWVAESSRQVVPVASFTDISTDAVDIVRDRIDAGLSVYVDRGALSHPSGHMPVLLSSPAFENAPFPMFTVHLISDDPCHTFVGGVVLPEVIGGDFVDEVIGGLSRYTIAIIGWCLNGDERPLLRKALKSLVLANSEVFAAAGMSEVEPRFSDFDDMNTYPAAVYQTTCTLTCIAPSAITTPWAAVKEVFAEFTPLLT